jgi:hypothetical protein
MMKKSREKQGDPFVLWVVGKCLCWFIISWLVFKEFENKIVLGDYGIQLCVCSNEERLKEASEIDMIG